MKIMEKLDYWLNGFSHNSIASPKMINEAENPKTSHKRLEEIVNEDSYRKDLLFAVLTNPSANIQTLHTVLDKFEENNSNEVISDSIIGEIFNNPEVDEYLIKRLHENNPTIEAMTYYVSHPKAPLSILEKVLKMNSRFIYNVKPYKTVDIHVYLMILALANNKIDYETFVEYMTNIFSNPANEPTIIKALMYLTSIKTKIKLSDEKILWITGNDSPLKENLAVEPIVYSLLNDHYPFKVSEKVLLTLRQSDNIHIRSRTYSSKQNSWENVQDQLFELYEEEEFYEILHNPNIPDHAFKALVRNLPADGKTQNAFSSTITKAQVSVESKLMFANNFKDMSFLNYYSLSNLTNVPLILIFSAFFKEIKRYENFRQSLSVELLSYFSNYKINIEFLKKVIKESNMKEVAKYLDFEVKYTKMIVALKPALTEDIIKNLLNSGIPEVRQALAFSEYSSSETLAKLSNDSDDLTRLLVALNDSTDQETLRSMHNDIDNDVKTSAFLNTNLTVNEIVELAENYENNLDVIRVLASHSNTPYNMLLNWHDHEDEIVSFNAIMNENTPQMVRGLMGS